MKKRFLGVAALLVLLVSFAGIRPVSAQEEPVLQPVVDTIQTVLDEAQPLFDELTVVTDPLNEGLTQLIALLQPLFDLLEQAVALLEPTCAALGPILEAIEPIIAELQPVLDLLDPETAPAQLDFIDPVLAEVDALADQVLTLCAAEAETTTTTAPAEEPAAPPAGELPLTGGPALLIPAGLALGLAAVLRAANRKL